MTKGSFIVAAAIAILVGAIGTYLIARTNAATSGISGPIPNSNECEKLGRKWDQATKNTKAKCSDRCDTKIKNNALQKNRAYNYCKQAISFISKNTCVNILTRTWSKYVDGCARRADQKSTKKTDWVHCISGRYIVHKNGDYCDFFGRPLKNPAS